MPKSKKAVTRKARVKVVNPNALPTVPAAFEQRDQWVIECALTKAFQRFLPVSLESVQVNVKDHAKGNQGKARIVEAKPGERLHVRAILSIPTRATCAVSAAGVNVAIVRRLFEAVFDLHCKQGGLDQGERKRASVDFGLIANPETIRQARALDKEAGNNECEAKARMAQTNTLNALALTVLKEVGRDNPVGNPYAELPDPAHKTISCAVRCPACESEREFSERRIPLDAKEVLKMAKELPFCGECGEDGQAGPRLEFKGGADALAERASDKFNKLAEELANAGKPADKPSADAKGKDLRAQIEASAQSSLAQVLSPLFSV